MVVDSWRAHEEPSTHRVPLTTEVIELIQSQEPKDQDERSEYVFAGLGGAVVLHRAKKAAAAIARVLKIDFRGHDLRRTAATGMAAAGIPCEHIGHVLNHVEGGARATRVYDRYAYDREKRIALEAWARTLKSILEPAHTPGRLSPSRRARNPAT